MISSEPDRNDFTSSEVKEEKYEFDVRKGRVRLFRSSCHKLGRLVLEQHRPTPRLARLASQQPDYFIFDFLFSLLAAKWVELFAGL